MRNLTNPDSLFWHVWPPAFLILALVITAAWIAFVGFEVIELIEMAFQTED
jgi:hypothetical protein